ncbi:4226_t:CDS:2, partial [Entrophospora sp. SA101]
MGNTLSCCSGKGVNNDDHEHKELKSNDSLNNIINSDKPLQNQKDIYSDERRQEYGTCAICNRYNTSKGQCKSCNQNDTQDVVKEEVDKPPEDLDNQFGMELPNEIKEDLDNQFGIELPNEIKSAEGNEDKVKDNDGNDEPPEDLDNQFGIELPNEIKNDEGNEDDIKLSEADKVKDNDVDEEPPEDIDNQFSIKLPDNIDDNEPP